MVYHGKSQGLGSRTILVNSNYPPQGLKIEVGAGPIPADWFNTDWKRRILFTVNNLQVPSTQSVFPALIKFIIPDLIGNVEADGRDIRIVLPNKDELKFQVTTIDNVTGELIVWFKMPTIQDGSPVYLYYKNPGAIAPTPDIAQDVWDANYKSVLHGNKIVPTNLVLDSTVNAKNATETLLQTTPGNGKIDKALIFAAANNDALIQPTILSPDGSSITVSCWMKPANNTDGYIIMKSDADDAWSLFFQAGNMGWRAGGPLEINTPSPVIGTYQYVVITQLGTLAKIYIDGIEKVNGTINQIKETNLPVRYGHFEGFDFDYVGDIQEMRISKIDKTSNFIKTEFNNQNAPGVFWTQSPPETIAFEELLFNDGQVVLFNDGQATLVPVIT